MCIRDRRWAEGWIRDRIGQTGRRQCGGRRRRAHSTHMGVQWEMEVPPELPDGTATPVFKHMQVGTAPELYGQRRVRVSTPKQPVAPWLERQGGETEAQATAAPA